MTLKKFSFLILLFVSIWQLTFSQELIGFVDMKKLVEEHPLKDHYDSIYVVIEHEMTDSFDLRQKEYNDLINSYLDCNPFPDSLKNNLKLAQEIMDKEELRIQKLGVEIQEMSENFINKMDSLKSKFNRLIRSDIIEEIVNYCKVKKYIYILDKDLIIFAKPEADLTNLIKEKLKNK